MLIQLEHEEDIRKVLEFGVKPGTFSQGKGQVSVKADQLNEFIRLLSTIDVISLESRNQGLEDIFLNLYGKEE